MSSSNSKSARAAVSKYKKGNVVNVYYDPNDPYISVLEPGPTCFIYAMIGGGLAFLLIGASILIGTMLKILIALAIIPAALGGLIGRESKPTQKLPNNTDPRHAFNQPNHSTDRLKNNTSHSDDGFDL